MMDSHARKAPQPRKIVVHDTALYNAIKNGKTASPAIAKRLVKKVKDAIDVPSLWSTPRKEDPARAAKVEKLQQDPLDEAGKIERLYRPGEQMRFEVSDRMRQRTKDHAARMAKYATLIADETARLWSRRNGR